MWGLWYYHNLLVWKEVQVAAVGVLSFVDSYLLEWRAARQTLGMVQLVGSSSPVPASLWSWPPAGQLKCNVDATIFYSERATGWAAIVRDSKRTFVRASPIFWHKLMDLGLAVIMRVREPLSWLCE